MAQENPPKYMIAITQASREEAAITIRELRNDGYDVSEHVGMGGFEMPYFVLVYCVSAIEQENVHVKLAEDYECGKLTLGLSPDE